MTWTNRRLRWFPLVAAAVLCAACAGGGDDDPELPPGVVEGSPQVAPAVTATSASPSPTETSLTCANEATITADPARQIGPSLEGDVDGDGITDSVSLAFDPAAPEGCAAFVAVDFVEGIAAAPVWEVGPEGGLPQPRLHGLTDIDGQPGDEVLVDEAAGASTQFVGAFAFVDGDLERITAAEGITDQPGAFEDLFPYGGSVGHVEAAGCVGDRIVVSVATPSSEQDEASEGIYLVKRHIFVVEDAELEEVETDRAEVPIDQLDRFPEFSSSPFGNC